jgi:hypothetical protein
LVALLSSCLNPVHPLGRGGLKRSFPDFVVVLRIHYLLPLDLLSASQ